MHKSAVTTGPVNDSVSESFSERCHIPNCLPFNSKYINPISDTPTGRPLIQLFCDRSRKEAFLDTGSSVSLVKRTSLENVSSRIHPCVKSLTDVSGSTLQTGGEVDIDIQIAGMSCKHRFVVTDYLKFPGDVLLGMDFLRRFDFKMVHKRSPCRSYLILQDIRLPLKYTDNVSCRIQSVNSSKPVSTISLQKLFEHRQSPSYAHVHRTTVCPPHSGRFIQASVSNSSLLKNVSDVFISGLMTSILIPRSIVKNKDGKVDIWIVNDSAHALKLRTGTRLAEVEPVSELSVSTISASDPTDFSIEEGKLKHLPPKSRKNLKDILLKYKSLFSGEKSAIGTIPGAVHRIITADSTPICTRQWRLPHSAKEVIKKTCQEMLDAQVIEPSCSPWSSPVVLVRKRDGNLRFCVDYRNLNAKTVSDSYPLPRIDEILDDLRDNTYFSILDARAAYWSITVAPEDREKTAFSDGSRLWQFRRMPFGLKTAPATFQRIINMVLSPVLGRHTLAYLDDVIIFSKDFEQHCHHLNETLSLMDKAGLKLNLDKCSFAVKDFKFLGFKISTNGISPDPDKVRSINELPPPTDVTGVRRFLGCVGFFRRHIPNFATIAAPLSSLTRKGQPFKWNAEHDASFRQLQHLLTTAPVLRRPDFSAPFELHTDASRVGIGSCLMQVNSEGNPCAVAYYSRKLRGSEIRYSVTDLEALAIIESVRHFDAYLYGKSFTIITDHRPLTYIFTRRTKSPRMSRWSHELMEYSYRIVYRKGSIHHVPDLLSRDIASIDLAIAEPTALREAQLKDPVWHEVIKFLEGSALPQKRLPTFLDEFELKDGVLYHLKVCSDKIIHRLVIPKTLQKEAIRISHDSTIAAHPGIFRTYHKLKEHYYFQNMLSATKQYVNACLPCQKRRGSVKLNAPLSQIPVVTSPLDRISADLMDLHSSYNGNRYLLSIIDHMSRYLQLIPLPNKSAQTIADAFVEHYFTLFGVPRMLTTDSGSEFKNKLFSEVCDILSIKMHYTTPFYPQANGLVERSNRCVKDAIATLCDDAPLSWDEYVPQVRYALNTAFHRAINNQPLFLFMGHSCSYPIGLTNRVTMNEDDTSTDHLLRLLKAREVAAETSCKTREENAKYYNRKVRERKINVGSLVMRRSHDQVQGVSRALHPRWLGPCRVSRLTSPVTFIVRDLSPPFAERKVHANQLKLFSCDADFSLLPQDSDSPVLSDSPVRFDSPRLHPMITRSQIMK